jgi:trans-aconitate 2-methyltransferase
VGGAGGVLAVQMPRNFGSPSHRIAAELAADPRWRDRLASRVRVDPVASAESYYELLSPICRWVEVWETEYLHVLGGEDPVVDWLRGTLLVPLLEPLDGAERTVLLAELSDRVSSVHPRRSDGTTLYPFRRMFLVAVKPAVSTSASG